jgi:hypothetical protein
VTDGDNAVTDGDNAVTDGDNAVTDGDNAVTQHRRTSALVVGQMTRKVHRCSERTDEKREVR